jgi:hypothetical protein
VDEQAAIHHPKREDSQMLKLTIAVLAVALAGTASAAGWKSLAVDASSEEAFEKSLAEFKETLTPARRVVFGEALKDIWVKGSLEAEANQREYAAADYYRQVHGLGYEGITTLTDPTGETAKRRYRAASRAAFRVWPQRIPSIMRTNDVYPRYGPRG